MKIAIDISSLSESRSREWAVRFLFGGAITAAAGLITAKWGPSVGGLFLAFPAIFPASATLVEKHERERKEKLGLHGYRRGRDAVGAEAAGAAMGSIGLAVFGMTVWMLLPRSSPWLVMPAATGVWFLTSGMMWMFRKHLFSLVAHAARS